MTMTEEEKWQPIREFPEYSISNLGRIYNNLTAKFQVPSRTQFGHMKVSFGPERHTRSVALLVAEAFVEPPDKLSDSVIQLDGNQENVAAYNLAWRPRWYAWKYTHQFKVQQPLHFKNLGVENLDTRYRYSSIIEAGLSEGVLFNDIWESTYMGRRIYPYGHKYRII